MSLVFNEVSGTLSTVAAGVRRAAGRAGTADGATQQLDRQLLTAWLNFANGAFDLGDPGRHRTEDKVPDTAFATVISNAETVRKSASSTANQLRAQRDLLEAING